MGVDWIAQSFVQSVKDVKESIGRIISGIFTPLLFEIIPSFRISVIKKSFPCSIISKRTLPSFTSKIVLGVKFSYISDEEN